MQYSLLGSQAITSDCQGRSEVGWRVAVQPGLLSLREVLHVLDPLHGALTTAGRPPGRGVRRGAGRPPGHVLRAPGRPALRLWPLRRLCARAVLRRAWLLAPAGARSLIRPHATSMRIVLISQHFGALLPTCCLQPVRTCSVTCACVAGSRCPSFSMRIVPIREAFAWESCSRLGVDGWCARRCGHFTRAAAAVIKR